MTAHDRWLDAVDGGLRHLRSVAAPAIEDAADRCARSIAGGGVVWVFGAGHSQLMAMEAYPRIGGVLGFVPMVELALLYFTNVVGSGGLEQTMHLERVEGYGESILRSHDPRPGDVLVIFSGSGVEVLPLEMARGARARGLDVVAVTSLAYSREAARRRGKDRILAEEADVVIDSGVPIGDATVDLGDGNGVVGPVSTMLHIAVMDCLAVDTAERLVELGSPPTVFGSPHLEHDGSGFEEALRRFRRLVARA